ncbi:MAG: MFS transporter [Treponema sp.]|nr:MFS transporter [Treponema sp.]
MASLIKHLPEKVKKLAKTNPAAIRYIMDGLLAASAVNIANSNYSLFAVRLGADDFQLSLVQFLPHFFTLLVLVPGGLLMNSLSDKKRAAITMMLIVMFGYFLCAISPFTEIYSIQFFLGSLALTGSAIALYNIAWQSFFPGVVKADTRNKVLTLRTRVTLIISMMIPLLVGAILTNIKSVGNKIIAHQAFFTGAVLLFFFAVLNFKRIRKIRENNYETARKEPPMRLKLSEIKNAAVNLLINKKFIIFTITALFFHMTWHFDWTLYFIGQVQYLKMNELQLGFVNLGAALIQLLTIKFWSRINERRGVTLPFIFGIIGLSLCPLFMTISVSLPLSLAPHLFIILHTIAHIPFCTVTLNLYQCILLSVDEKNVSFYISVFSSLLCLSNSVMPVAGVALYHALGGDLNGFRHTLMIIFILRLIAAFLWFLWWKRRAVSSEMKK